MKRVYLGLGSNLGDGAAQLRRTLAMLPGAGVQVTRVSSFYQTQPVDFSPQPWFANCVAEADTKLLPLGLLRRLKGIERALGRRPGGVAKGPRAIDIDILLYGDAAVRSAELTIPHPRLEQRRFVLVPLSEIAPDVRHPVTQLTVREMLAQTGDRHQVKKMMNAE
ncbi:MAG TPA: 2-amino-4-hydroxy-6-hydroxymethyldihydropteridine diphosphokinase [Terriglobia bacterium]|nr:2-amino-4-hydroxy-6-hydroxymethyldihydropteridine diphosphokinase [Terriglobia bacterium]